MEALTELCDLVAGNPTLHADKLAWIRSRCPPPAFLLAADAGAAVSGVASGGARVSRGHLHALLALARLLSLCPSPPPPAGPLLDFVRAIHPTGALRPGFWPQSFSLDSISQFLDDVLRYAALAADRHPELAPDLSNAFGDALLSAAPTGGGDSPIARAFLTSVSRNLPPIRPADADRLVECLLDQFGADDLNAAATSSSSFSEVSASWSSSVQSTASRGKGREVADDATSEVSSSTAARGNENGGVSGRSSVDQLAFSDGVGGGGRGGGESPGVRQDVAAFEDESVEGLEKQEIAFRLFGQVLDRVGKIEAGHLEKVRKVATKQLKSLPKFLKVEWLKLFYCHRFEHHFEFNCNRTKF